MRGWTIQLGCHTRATQVAAPVNTVASGSQLGKAMRTGFYAVSPACMLVKVQHSAILACCMGLP